MSAYTYGHLRDFNWVDEASYATIPVGALSWGGNVEELTYNIDHQVEWHFIPGTRTAQEQTWGEYKAGFDVKYIARATSGAYEWQDLWAYYGLGSATAVTDTLDSFTAQFGKAVAANNYYNVFNGCKVNKAIISGEKVGKPLIFELDCLAQYMTPDTDKNLTGIQTVKVGADAAAITTASLKWAGILTINIAGGGATNFYPKNWKLTVDNDLQPQYGHRLGGDGTNYPVAVALNEGKREITFEATLVHENETYTNAKLNHSVITAITIPVEDHTITLSTGYFEPNEFPTLKHGVMDEPIKARFETITVSA